MANALYTKYKEHLLTALNDQNGPNAVVDRAQLWANNDIGVVVNCALIQGFEVPGGYLPNLVTDEFFSTAPLLATNVVQTGAAIQPVTGRVNIANVADAADVTFPLLGGPPPTFRFVVLYFVGTVPGQDDRLIACIDTTASGPTLPFTVTGANLILSWSLSGIFAL